MAAELIGKRIPVLDKGWVELIDLMPHPATGVAGDLAIVNAARVSFLGESKGDDKDKKLLFYMLRNKHTSPFEMVVFKFRIRAPLITWWQWARHRSACLAGDTELYFDLPAAVGKGRRQVYKLRLDEIYRKWTTGGISVVPRHKKPLYTERIVADHEYSIPQLASVVERAKTDLRNQFRLGSLKGEKRDGRIYIKGENWLEYACSTTRDLISPIKERLGNMKLRMCNEETGEIEYTHLTDVYESGVKPVFRLILENGYSLKMSRDHRILTEAGWLTLEQATHLNISASGKVTWHKDSPAVAVNGIPAYKDYAWLKARRDEGLEITVIAEMAGVSYHTIRKYLRIHGLQFSSQEKARLSGLAQRGQKRNLSPRGKMTPEAYTRFIERQGGQNSNFWKGGITPERALIGQWTTQVARSVHEKYQYQCVVCEAVGGNLHAHHIDPVWHNPARARDTENLVSVCAECHRTLHKNNLELIFMEAWQSSNLGQLRIRLQSDEFRQQRPLMKRKPTPTRLLRHYSKIKRIEYCGEEMTYDVSVAGPFHNFIANGMVVHNSYNAQSGRYVEFEENDFYVPDIWRKQSSSNKQASEGQVTDDENSALTEKLLKHYNEGFKLYEEALKTGVSREMARLFLPGFSVYYSWIVKMDAHNLMHFLKLRMANDAQYEIRVYAQAIYEHFFRAALPWTAEAFEKYILNSEEK